MNEAVFQLTYEPSTETNLKGTVKYFIAPKVDDDMDEEEE